MTPTASLILITYNSAHLLPTFFETLAHTSGVSYEVIVVDNRSADTTCADVAGRAGVRLIAQAENLGFGRACNQGAAAASGEVLVFLNPDVTFTPGWLVQLAAGLREHSDAAILCPETLYPGQAIPDSAAVTIEERDCGSGSCMAIRRTAWEELGGFDEQIFMYWEDTDLCWRAWLRGWRVLRDRRAVVYHTRGGSGGGRHWVAEATRNGLYVHLKLMRWRIALPFMARQALASLMRAARGTRGLGDAWAWNMRHLGQTLAQRRSIVAGRRIEPGYLEQLIRRRR
jgi:N-acetylglucosaminyl-diphospho-decaprenol L-rhamnosyltransferase